MTVVRYNIEIPRLSAEQLGQWSDIPSSAATDCLGRRQAMASAIKPLTNQMRILGQARTIDATIADNSALHGAVETAAFGDILVCDGKGYTETALFGDLLARVALKRGIGGLVIDGAIRDSAQIIELGFDCFSRAVTPRGPVKSTGGILDGHISCGGIAVSPGDLVIGDADGVIVVPFAQIDETLTACRALLDKEARAEHLIASGQSILEIYNVPDVEIILPD